MKRIRAFFIICVLLVTGFSLDVFAGEVQEEGVYIDESSVRKEDPIRYDLIGIQPRWTYTSSATMDLGYDGSHAVCYVYVSGNSNCTKITGDLILYKKVGSSYTKLVTWSGLTSTSDYLSREREWPVSRGYTYRLVFSGRASGIGGSEPLYLQTESTFG